VGSLKDFEICDVLEKELPHTRQEVINLFGTVICPDISARSYINSSARLVVAKIQGLIGSHQKIEIVKLHLTETIRADQHLLGARIR
jgi:hypothetical protein